MPITGQDLIVNRADLSDAKLVPSQFPDIPAPGTCLLRVDSYALTANTITYAVAPDHIGYWQFFPSNLDGYGRVPAWGFAEVIASAVPEVPVGTRVYGYLPMSTHLVVQPGHIKAHGFSDVAEHRQPMAPIYNQYSLTAADPFYSPENEPLISLFRPLFTTSFLLNALHRDEAYFGAKSVILSSASSKTAISLAFLLAQDAPDGTEIVGLTSDGNRAFVENLGCYTKVLSYDQVSDLPVDPAAFVDMAGNTDLLRAVHGHFGDALKNSCRVGLTHWQSTSSRIDGLPGPKPEFFFAPTYALEKIKQWGPEGFQTRLAKAWSAFAGPAAGWTTVTHHTGPEAAVERYKTTLAGNMDPAEGQIISLWPS
jgi:hypothetical protein